MGIKDSSYNYLLGFSDIDNYGNVFQRLGIKKKILLSIIKYALPGFSFVYVGLILKAQPTTTNIIIFF